MAAYNVTIPQHAHTRMLERFPGETPAVYQEVNAALTAGRVSATRPVDTDRQADRRCLYCWTPDRRRVYVIRIDTYAPDQFAVVTVIRPTPDQLNDWRS